MKPIFLIFLITSLLFEVTFTTIPLLLIALNLYTVIYKKGQVFFYAFIFGVLFDMLTFKTVGASSILFIMFSFLVLLYQRKFEIETPFFVAISTFLGSFFYLFFVFSKPLIFESLAAAVTSVIAFIIIGKIDSYG